MRYIAFIVALLILVPAGFYFEFVYPSQQITAELEKQGYTDVQLTWEPFSGHLSFECSSKQSTVRSFTARKDHHVVTGTGCFEFVWGVKIWPESVD